MFNSPNERDIVLYESNGMLFRTHISGIDGKNRAKQSEKMFTDSSISFPSKYSALIVGKRRSKINELLEIAKCRIYVEEGQQKWVLHLSSPDEHILEEGVFSLGAYVNGLIGNQPITHIICLPICNKEFREEFVKFYEGLRGVRFGGEAYEYSFKMHIPLLKLRILHLAEEKSVVDVFNKVTSEHNYTFNKNSIALNTNCNYIFDNDSRYKKPLILYGRILDGDFSNSVKRLQQKLVKSLEVMGVEVTETCDVAKVPLLYKEWTKGGVFGCSEMNVSMYEKKLPNISLSNVALCKLIPERFKRFYNIVSDTKF